MLLTSAGVTNASIHAALEALLGKPVAACRALCIPTAGYGQSNGGAAGAWSFIAGRQGLPMAELGWQSLGVLELTALPSMGPERWVSAVQAADVLLAKGGDALFLSYWMRASGLAALLPELDVVWVGYSAGSMVMAPRIGEEFVEWLPPSDAEGGGGGAVDDRALGLVDFAIFPHVDHPNLPENTLAHAERWAAKLDCPAYAIDDATAIRVVDGEVGVISEGHWRQLR